MTRGAKLQTGDVFTIPLDENRIGVGQVVATYLDDGYYFAVFDATFPPDTSLDLDSLVREPIAFLTLSLDALIHAGHWVVVGRAPVTDDLPLPAYKEMVGGPERVDVVDYSGRRRRRASAAEAGTLPNRSIVAPARLEKALRAHCGLEPWQEAFAKLRPSASPTTAKLF